MFYVYILQSSVDQKFYIGQTQSLEKRLALHNRGKVLSTRKRRPFTLLWYKYCATRAESMKLERYLKSLKGGNEFKKLLHCWGVAKR